MELEFLPFDPPTPSTPPEPPDPSPSGLQFRDLTPEEIATLEPEFKARGGLLPDPATSRIIGGVEDGKVVAFLVLQLKLHAQPVWLAPGRSELFTRLVHTAEETILRTAGPQWVYLFAPGGRLNELAESMGMSPEPWTVMSKLVTVSIPERGVLNFLDAPILPEPEPDAPTPETEDSPIPAEEVLDDE